MDLLPETLTISALTIFVFFNFLFLIAVVKNDNSIVDIGWGIGFIINAIITFFYIDIVNYTKVVTLVLIIIWGTRLSIHIFLRNKGKGEDYRYKKWREDWKKFFLIRSYLQIFILQSSMMFIISFSVNIINIYATSNISPFFILGTICWIIGFVFETLGDLQLTQFKSKSQNKGKIMQSGVWRYTRHPNYFGESAIWWGVFLIAFPLKYGIFTIISPVIITFLLIGISGIPMLERKYKDNIEFQNYKKKTSAFFPWFPKS